MAMNDYHITSLGYKEIYGTKGMTLDEIRELLKQYDLNALIEFSTKLGIALFHTSGQPEQLIVGQKAIVRSLYQDEKERSAFVRLLSRAVAANKAGGRWGLFSKHSTLFFLKLAFENGVLNGGKMVSPKVASELAKILLSITDYLEANDFNLSAIILPDDYRRIQLREFMFRRLKFTVEEQFPNPLYRYMKIISYLKTQHKEFNFSKYFKDDTGLSLKTFYDIGTMLSLRWGVKKNEFNLDEDWCINKETYFKDVKISKAALSKLYSLLAFNLKDYDKVYSWTVGILNSKDIYDYNYLFLRKFPLVEVSENLLACPSPEYLISKVTEGPYMIVSDYLKDTGNTKGYKSLPSLWGEAFEYYADVRLKNIFGSEYQKVPEHKSNQRADGIYEGKQSILIFETKSIHISYKATVTGSEKDLAVPLSQCFGKKHGVAQQVAHAKDIYEGKITLKSKLLGRKMLPVLVISDYLPSEPFHYKFFQKLLRNNGVRFNQSYLLPFIYLTIEEVEFLEAIATETSKADIEQLLVDYSKKVSVADLGNDFSFKNYLYSNGIKIPLNKSLMEDFEKHTNSLKKRYFKKASSSK